MDPATTIRTPSKPFRTALRWQLFVTVLAAAICWWRFGKHGAISAGLGGAIALCGSYAYVRSVSRPSGNSPGDTLVTMFRAEASKLVLIVILLWMVLGAYKGVVLAGFLPTFFVTILVFQMAFFIKDS